MFILLKSMYSNYQNIFFSVFNRTKVLLEGKGNDISFDFTHFLNHSFVKNERCSLRTLFLEKIDINNLCGASN